MSYANLSDILSERGISVNHTTIYRWFIHYGPILHKRLRQYQFTCIDSSCQLGETYVKVKGNWHCLYRAINKREKTLDFFFSHKRNKEAACQFLKRCLRRCKESFHPNTLNTDKHFSYDNAIVRFKHEGRLREDVEHWPAKFFNNGIESLMPLLRKLIEATGG